MGAGRTPISITVLCGLDRERVADLGAGLLLRAPRLALIWVDPWTAELGYLQCRVTDSDGRCTEQVFELTHNCLSCTMRETVATTIRRLAATGRYDTVLVHLHPGVEATSAAGALISELGADAVLDTVVLALEPDWLTVLACDRDVAELGIAVTGDDDRPAAGVLAADLDAATTVVLGGLAAPTPEGVDALQAHAALNALCPDARRVYPQTPYDLEPGDVLRTGAYDPGVHEPLTRGGLLSPHAEVVTSSGSLSLVRWTAGRPVHPQRLHDALEQLADGVIRSSGRLWIAPRPDLVVTWDSAGDRLALGPEARWPRPLLSVGGAPWGGRHNVVVFLGDDLDADAMRAALDACLLTDAELAMGPEAWRRLPDPFPEWGDGADERQEGAA